MALRFTFQSGDIQITFGQISSTFESAFTFQSGDIQIKQVVSKDIAKEDNLHSNLVIFKSVLNIITYLLILKVLFCRP